MVEKEPLAAAEEEVPVVLVVADSLVAQVGDVVYLPVDIGAQEDLDGVVDAVYFVGVYSLLDGNPDPFAAALVFPVVQKMVYSRYIIIT